MLNFIPKPIRNMWLCFEGLNPHLTTLSTSQSAVLEEFHQYFSTFCADNFASPDQPVISDCFKQQFLQVYHSHMQTMELAAVTQQHIVPTTVPPPLVPEPTPPLPAKGKRLAPATTAIAAVGTGSIPLFPAHAHSQLPIATLNAPLPLPPNKPVDPNIPWTIIGKKKRGHNKPCSFAAAVSGSNQPPLPS